ncbi:DUF924-domain-containing protein, partial [Aureobasidium melanogenum]
MPETDPDNVLREAFAPDILDSVHDFWFSHLSDPSHVVVPGTEDVNVWFVDKSDEYDNVCRDKFGFILENIISQQASAEQILTAANPSTALEWMTLIILLDQIPRNCYRGMEAAKVTRIFDPLARAIALKAREQDMHKKPEVRFRLGYRLWFFMPMEHAEDLKMQNLMVEEQKQRFKDMDSLMQDEPDTEDDVALSCRSILLRRKEEFELCRSVLQKAVDEHYDAIKKFGRFPYRNLALGRTTTIEEQEFLDTKWLGQSQR